MKKVNKKRKSRAKKEDNSYVIKDKYLGNVKIKHTANAWWKSEAKVVQLLSAYKAGCTTKECLIDAGITADQLKYFKKEHPEISPRLKELKKVPSIHARKLIALAIKKGSIKTAQWYLERKLPDEFKERRDVTSDDKPILVEDVLK